MLLRLFFPVLLVFGLASCAPHRQLAYLQEVERLGDTVQFSKPEFRLRPGDILHLRVTTLDRETRQLFEPQTVGLGTGGMMSNAQFFLSGYTIAGDGTIEVPVVGKIAVGGLTVQQANEAVRQTIAQYLTDATVSVSLVNFSVTVLGEVNSPGQFYIYDSKITIMDAIGMAGDLTDFGSRRIHVVRRGNEGVHFNTIDITSRQAISSEVFFLQPGDLVYVEPMRIKRLGFAQFPFGPLFSAISTTLLLINFFDRPNN